MVSAIVLAGGSGSRMNSSTAKQYMDLCGMPVVAHALKAFQETEVVDEIVLVTRLEDIDYARTELVQKYGLTKVSTIVQGGKERFDSVWQGILATGADRREFAPVDTDGADDINDLEESADRSDPDIIMIHDGARPLVSPEMIRASVEAARTYGACTVAVPVKDTIKVVKDGFGIDTPDRSGMYQVQTPQTFRRDVITAAHEAFRKDSRPGITDDTMLVEEYLTKPVYIVPGAYSNLKITTPEDLDIAAALLSKRGDFVRK